MTKAELIERILRAGDLPPEVTKKTVTEVVDSAFSELADYFVSSSLDDGGSVRFTYPGFGTFTKKRRSPRKGVNPRTLEPLEIAASQTVDFRPSADFKADLNSEAGAERRGSRRPGQGSRSNVVESKRRRSSPPAGKVGRKLSDAAANSAVAVEQGGGQTSGTEVDPRQGSLFDPSFAVAGPSGRRLRTRDAIELETSLEDKLVLPTAPLQRAANPESSEAVQQELDDSLEECSAPARRN